MKSKIKIISASLVLLILLLGGYYIFNHNNDTKIKILDLKNNQKQLLFYGSEHSNDKNDPMFKDIKEKFYDMKPQIVLVEGNANKNSYFNADEAIKRGESAYVTFLAQENNIPLESVEPSEKDQYDYLLQKYDKNRVLIMYILRQTYQYQNQNKNTPINYKLTIQRYVYDMMRNGFPISEEETRIENILNLLKKYTNQIVDNDNWLNIDVKALMYRESGEFNGVYNDVLEFRNKHLLETIEQALNEHHRVFVIMGSGHVIEEEENIREIFNNY